MKLQQIVDDNILLAVIWISSENTVSKNSNARYRSWRRIVEKNYRRIEYKNSEGGSCFGFVRDGDSEHEPLALYIRDLFGDGIYYTNEAENENYLLIISNGEVVEGTDIYINDALFEWYTQNVPSGKYASLQWTCFTLSHINDVLEANTLHKKSVNKKKMTYISVLLGVGIACLSLFGIALKIFVGT